MRGAGERVVEGQREGRRERCRGGGGEERMEREKMEGWGKRKNCGGRDGGRDRKRKRKRKQILERNERQSRKYHRSTFPVFFPSENLFDDRLSRYRCTGRVELGIEITAGCAVRETGGRELYTCHYTVTIRMIKVSSTKVRQARLSSRLITGSLIVADEGTGQRHMSSPPFLTGIPSLPL